MSVLEQILERARAAPKRVVFPESDDPRVLSAAARLAREGIVEPLLVGSRSQVTAAAAAAGAALDGLTIVDPSRDAARDDHVDAALEQLQVRGMNRQQVEQLLADPLYYAAAMVRSGAADGTVAGATHPTAETLRAALRILGPAPGVRVVSSFFLMRLREATAAGDEVLAFADSGSSDELADIQAAR